MSFIQGRADSTVFAGKGAESFTLTRGEAGRTLTVKDFAPGSDTVRLVGYQPFELSTKVVGGTTSLMLSDNTRIDLLGLTSMEWRPLFA